MLGYKIVKQSSLRKLQFGYLKFNIDDIEKDTDFMKIYHKIKDFTLVEIERCYALYTSVLYIVRNNISGDFTECGVWKGGSSMLMALALKKMCVTDRKIYLYDTFTGMTEPGENDGETEKEEWKKMRNEDGTNNWCFASYKDVALNMRSTGYPSENIILIQGKVEDTIPGNMPAKIALLRLDTDWYESTKHELDHLYPLLQKNGVLIIDDYGAWPGSQKATDEYFSDKGPIYLNRIDSTGRILIKH